MCTISGLWNLKGRIESRGDHLIFSRHLFDFQECEFTLGSFSLDDDETVFPLTVGSHDLGGVQEADQGLFLRELSDSVRRERILVLIYQVADIIREVLIEVGDVQLIGRPHFEDEVHLKHAKMGDCFGIYVFELELMDVGGHPAWMGVHVHQGDAALGGLHEH